MKMFNNILNWASDKVQTVTGEKERRQLVAELRSKFDIFKQDVEKKVHKLNQAIENFNSKIRDLNDIRKGLVKNNIILLADFLAKYGAIKNIEAYCSEDEKRLESLPEHKFDKIDDYIANVDWSSDDVFLNTFFLSPLGMKRKTRKQNLSMREKIHEFQMEAEETITQLKMKTFGVEQEQQICNLYISNVRFISNFIEMKILPELSLVEAFLQAEHIKNKILANHPLLDLAFKYDISMIKETIYEKHYYFVKNAFMFYVLSCKIYNTPILTKLFHNQTTQMDVTELKKHQEVIQQQSKILDDQLLAQR